jgi:preprotein translocase subunit SecG
MKILSKTSLLKSFLPWLLLYSLGVVLASKIYTLPFALVLSFTFTAVAFVFHVVNVRFLFDRFFNRHTIHWYGLFIIVLIVLPVTLVGLVSMQGSSNLNLSLTDSQSVLFEERGAVFFVRRASGLAMILVFIASTSSKLLMAQTQENLVDEQKNTIILRAEGKDHKVELKDLLYIKAESEYISYHLTNEKLMVYGSLAQASENLVEKGFVRVHRSYTVSTAHIKAVGTKSLTLTDKTEIPIGRTFRDALKALSLAE